MASRHLPALDGFRGIACLVVLIAHLTPFYVSGAFGVDMFFVLSGFLITGILASELSRHERIHLINFYARRFLRLLPALWMTVGAVILSLWFTGHLESLYIREALYALTYVSNWVHALGLDDRYYLGHTWSLAIEEQFYLIWPFALMLLSRLRLGPLGNASVLASLAVVVMVYRNIPDYDAMRIYRGLDTHCDGLLLGSALSYFMRSPVATDPRVTRWLRVAAYFAIFVLLALPIRLGWTSWPTPILGYTTINVMSCLVIWHVMVNQEGWLTRLLSVRPLTYTGKISYGLYLYHWPIALGIHDLLPDLEGAWYILAPLILCLAYITSELSYRFIESRFLALKHHFT